MMGSSSRSYDRTRERENNPADPRAQAEPLRMEAKTNRDLFELREGDIIPYLRMFTSSEDQQRLSQVDDLAIFRELGSNLLLASAYFTNIHDRYARLAYQRQTFLNAKAHILELKKQIIIKDKLLADRYADQPSTISELERILAEKDQQLADKDAELQNMKDAGLTGKQVDARITVLKMKLSEKGKQFSEQSREMKDKDAELEEKDQQVIAALESVSTAEASLLERDVIIEDLQIKLQSCEAEISRLNDGLAREKQAFQKTLVTQAEALSKCKNEGLDDIQAAIPGSMDSAYRFSVTAFRTRLFRHAVGQRFLHTLFDEMIETYK